MGQHDDITPARYGVIVPADRPRTVDVITP